MPVEPQKTDKMPNARQGTPPSAEDIPSANDVWQSELRRKCVVVGKDIDDYIKKVMPEDNITRPPCPQYKGGLFRMPKKECDDYQGKLAGAVTLGLNPLASSFPIQRRIAFHNNQREDRPLLLGQTGNKKAYNATPDIVAGHPTWPALLPTSSDATWWDVSLVVDVNAEDKDDPMSTSDADPADSLERIERSVNCIMLAQGKLYVFALGVYGHLARLYRVDRAGMMVSPAFEYAKQPESISEFLTRFIKPSIPGKDCTVLGCDETTWIPTDEEYAWARSRARQFEQATQKTSAVIDPIEHCRWFALGGFSENRTEYLGYKLVSAREGDVFGRGTAVWKALTTEGERVMIKEVWHPLSRLSERTHYTDILKQAEEEGLDLGDIGIPLLLRGEDLGAREQQIERPGLKVTRTGLEALKSHTQDTPIGHQTITARVLGEANWSDCDRNHERLVFETSGTPLGQFGLTKNLVQAMRDAILGHKLAFEGGVLHYDISDSNILMRMCHEAGVDVKGFLNDFDHAFGWKRFLRAHGWKTDMASWKEFVATGEGIVEDKPDDPQTARWKKRNVDLASENTPRDFAHRTGTYRFCSLNSLQEDALGSPPDPDWVQDESDDLESFFWVLIFIIMRRNIHRGRLDAKAGRPEGWNVKTLFPDGTEHDRAFHAKLEFLQRTNVKVPNDRPFNRLLEDFRLLCLRNSIYCESDTCPRTPLTHDAVLEVFDKALAAKAWPEQPPESYIRRQDGAAAR